MANLTDKAVSALKPRDHRYEVWDDRIPAFGVRVGTSGAKSFIFVYHFEGRPRRLTLGRYPAMSLADAHLAAAAARKNLELGTDPGTQVVSQRQEARMGSTIKELVAEYIERDAKRNKRSWREDERILNKDILPKWKHRKAADIGRRDVAALLGGIVDRGAGVQANRTYTVIRRMFRYARNQGYIDVNPCSDIDRPTKERARDVILDEAHIKAFWSGIDKADMSPGIRLILRLVLVTAQRKGEVTNIAKADLDLENALWTIPAGKVKNGRTHVVPLSSLAVDLMRVAWTLSKDSPWLFPSPRGAGAKPVTGPAVDHAMRNNRVALGLSANGDEAVGTCPTPHDLRRTAASMMTAGGIPRLHVDRLLNHVDASVGAIYDRHDYMAEKRHAVEVWDCKLQAITSDKPEGEPLNVVALHRATEPMN